MEIARIVDGNVKCPSCSEKAWQSLKVLNGVANDPAIYKTDIKTQVFTETCTGLFIAALFIIPKKGNNPMSTN